MAKSNVAKYVATAICLVGYGQHPVAHAATEQMCVRAAVGINWMDGQVAQANVPAVLAFGGYRGHCRVYGDGTGVGQGYVRTFFTRLNGGPGQVGVEIPEKAFSGLPRHSADMARCFDANGNSVDDEEECVGGHADELAFPPQAAALTPFRWLLMNWNSHGHVPTQVYTVPHFDFHFFMQPFTERNDIDLGPCALMIDCADFAKAIIPVPAKHMPKDYVDVGAAEAKMGNHLVDLTSPEFNGSPFDHTFIFGSYDGKITFFEPMITKSYFESKPNACFDIKQPAAFSKSGYYPTAYCIRHDKSRKEYTVTLESFVQRQGQP